MKPILSWILFSFLLALPFAGPVQAELTPEEDQQINGPIYEYRKALERYEQQKREALASHDLREKERIQAELQEHERKRKLYNTELKAMNVVFRRIVKILEGNYGGMETIPGTAQSLQKLLDLHGRNLDVPAYRSELEKLAKEMAELKQGYKKEKRLPPFDVLEGQIEQVESDRALDPKIGKLLREYFIEKAYWTKAYGLSLGITYFSTRASLGVGLSKAHNACGRNYANICGTIGGDLATGLQRTPGPLEALGFGANLYGFRFSGKTKKGESKLLIGQGAGLLVGTGVYLDFAALSRGQVVLDQDPTLFEAGIFAGFQTHDMLRRVKNVPLFKLGIDYDYLREALGILDAVSPPRELAQGNLPERPSLPPLESQEPSPQLVSESLPDSQMQPQQDANPPEASEAKECAICLDPLKLPPKRGIYLAPCQHSFHYEGCLEDWEKKGKSNCPLCRAPLSGENPEVIDES